MKAILTWPLADDQNSGHVIHYPLNGLNLSFDCYQPVRYGPADIMAHNIMQDLLFPSRIDLDAYRKPLTHGRQYMKYALRGQHNALAMDLRTLDHMLLTDSILPTELGWKVSLQQSPLFSSSKGQVSLEHAALDVVRRFYLERDSVANDHWLRLQSLANVDLTRDDDTIRPPQIRRPPQSEKEIEHLKKFQRARDIHHQNFLCSRAALPHLAHRLSLLMNWTNDLYIVPNLWYLKGDKKGLPRNREYWIKYDESKEEKNRTNPAKSRSSSVPVRGYHHVFGQTSMSLGERDSAQILFPAFSIQDMDHRSRRRSLSRRHISRMLLNQGKDEIEANNQLRQSVAAGCTLCGQSGHKLNDCDEICLRCGSVDHDVNNCSVSRQNICKCEPFPQLHRAQVCRRQCSRRCGNPWPPGHYKHKSAMTCKYRCCMCGMRGHSGLDCNLKRCRCGEWHLGQDCGWHPTCRVTDCDRYLCGIHCRECGSIEKPFVGWRCQTCLGNGKPAGERVAKDKGSEEKPHLEQQRFPIDTGERTAAEDENRAETELPDGPTKSIFG